MTGQQKQHQEFPIHPWTVISEALRGLLVLTVGAVLMTHGLLLLLDLEGAKPKGFKVIPVWLSGPEFAYGLWLTASSLYRIWQAWRQRMNRVRLLDDGLLIEDKFGERQRYWSDFEMIYEVQVEVGRGPKGDPTPDLQ